MKIISKSFHSSLKSLLVYPRDLALYFLPKQGCQYKSNTHPSAEARFYVMISCTGRKPTVFEATVLQLLQKRNCRKQKQTCLLTCFENDFRPPFHWCLNYLTAPCSNWISVRKPLSTYENWLLLPIGKSLAHFEINRRFYQQYVRRKKSTYLWTVQSG